MDNMENERGKKKPFPPPFLHLLQYGTVAGNEVLQFYVSRSVLCGFFGFFFSFFIKSCGVCHFRALSSNLEATNSRHGKDIM